MNNQQNNITLEEIALQKEKLRKRIGVQKQKMTTLTQGFIAPLKPTVKKSNAVMGAFNTSLAIFDGVFVAYKLLRKVKKLFR
jgi:hypothetical protein